MRKPQAAAVEVLHLLIGGDQTSASVSRARGTTLDSAYRTLQRLDRHGFAQAVRDPLGRLSYRVTAAGRDLVARDAREPIKRLAPRVPPARSPRLKRKPCAIPAQAAGDRMGAWVFWQLTDPRAWPLDNAPLIGGGSPPNRADGYRAETTQEVPCTAHPDAPHGFNRNSSHTLGRYVCDCEGWVPDNAM